VAALAMLKNLPQILVPVELAMDPAAVVVDMPPGI